MNEWRGVSRMKKRESQEKIRKTAGVYICCQSDFFMSQILAHAL